MKSSNHDVHPSDASFDASGDLRPIVEPLLLWYEQHRRPLPWRTDPTPYHVWISEIMLQQTRIEAVLPYYERFLSAFPTVEALAVAEDDRLMKLWEGLGYYNRARNLKRAAQRIVELGEMPKDLPGLLSLPGIGAYTAGAIASIAFGLPEPAVDGNVLRVITRLLADESDVRAETTKRHITDRLRAIYPTDPAGASAMTQALMELGEVACIPNGTPHCENCPLGAFCLARLRGLTGQIPLRSPKKPRTVLHRTVLLLIYDGKIAIRKRSERGLLSGLWEFPAVETALDRDGCCSQLRAMGFTPVTVKPAGTAVHLFTHIEWHMNGFLVELSSDQLPADAPNGLIFVTPHALQSDHALPSAFRAFLPALPEEE